MSKKIYSNFVSISTEDKSLLTTDPKPQTTNKTKPEKRGPYDLNNLSLLLVVSNWIVNRSLTPRTSSIILFYYWIINNLSCSKRHFLTWVRFIHY